MTMSRSSLRIRCAQSMVVVALPAGSTVKTWSYLFLTKRASFARRPASAAATGDDSSPTVETVVKSTVQGMTHSRTRHGMSVYVGPEATSAVKPAEREFGTADHVDDALAVPDESGISVGPLLHGLRAARPVAEAAIATELAMFSRPGRWKGLSSAHAKVDRAAAPPTSADHPKSARPPASPIFSAQPIRSAVNKPGVRSR